MISAARLSLQRNKSRSRQRVLVHNPLRVLLQRWTEAPRVLEGLSLPPGAHCIEIGSGQGAGTLLVSLRFDCGRIVGVDNDPHAIERARSYVARPPAWARGTRTGAIEFAYADAAHLPYASGSFDAAFLFAVLNSVDDWRQVVSEVFRVLKPGARFAFKEAVRPVSPPLLSRLFFFMPLIGRDELEEHLIRTGFVVERFSVSKRRPRAFVLARKPSVETEGIASPTSRRRP